MAGGRSKRVEKFGHGPSLRRRHVPNFFRTPQPETSQYLRAIQQLEASRRGVPVKSIAREYTLDAVINRSSPIGVDVRTVGKTSRDNNIKVLQIVAYDMARAHLPRFLLPEDRLFLFKRLTAMFWIYLGEASGAVGQWPVTMEWPELDRCQDHARWVFNRQIPTNERDRTEARVTKNCSKYIMYWSTNVMIPEVIRQLRILTKMHKNSFIDSIINSSD